MTLHSLDRTAQENDQAEIYGFFQKPYFIFVELK